MKVRRNLLGTVNPKNQKSYMVNPYPKGFTKVNVPEGKSGDWAVEKFTPGAELGLYNLRLIRDGYKERIVPPGTYTRLVHGGTVVMSDTPAEAHEHFDAWCNAKGHVLVNGLGLGFYLKAILAKPEVTQVTVIEKSPDVLKLVSPVFSNDKRVTIIEADAMTWRPAKGQRYGYVWHDIWDDICDDNKVEMRKLRSAYARYTEWQGCWSADYL